MGLDKGGKDAPQIRFWTNMAAMVEEFIYNFRLSIHRSFDRSDLYRINSSNCRGNARAGAVDRSGTGQKRRHIYGRNHQCPHPPRCTIC